MAMNKDDQIKTEPSDLAVRMIKKCTTKISDGSPAYRLLEGQWQKKVIKGREKTTGVTISELAANEIYKFIVSSECEVGVSPWSKISQIKTKSLPEIDLAKRMLQKCETKISDGSPEIYELPLKTKKCDEKKQISKYCVSSPDKGEIRELTEKVFMLIGATGAGKTTLINSMANYVLGVKWEEGFRFKLTVKEEKRSQAQSQTAWISAYTFPKMKGSPFPYQLTIVDTPGFGDTGGIERDKHITKQIKEFFSLPGKDGIDHLDGIGFVVQSSLARLTHTQRYIFDSILAIFGKDVGQNIFMMVTFADGGEPPVLEAVSSAGISFNESFTFNNLALYNNQRKNKFDKIFWEMGHDSFKNFFQDLRRMESKSLQLTKEVLKERENLEVTIEGLQKRLSIGLSKLYEIQQEEKILEDHKEEMDSNQSFKYEVKVKKKIQVDNLPGRYATNCTSCEVTCHDNCDESSWHEYFCSAIYLLGYCKVCPGKCWVTNHQSQQKYKYEWIDTTEERTSDELKKKYDDAVAGKTKQESMISKMKEHLQYTCRKVHEMITEIKKSLDRLDEIALKPNPLSVVQYIELLIESEKQEAKPGFQQRMQDLEKVKQQAKHVSTAKNMPKSEQQEYLDKSEKNFWERFHLW